jgi:hypothetical protein
MNYKLYVLVMKDGTWRMCPYADGSDKQNTYHLTGNSATTFNYVKEAINTGDANISSREFVADITSDRANVSVQDAMELAFKMDLRRRPDVFKLKEPVADPNVEKTGNWSQTFIILTLERLEKDKVVKEGTAEEFKKKV